MPYAASMAYIAGKRNDPMSLLTYTSNHADVEPLDTPATLDTLLQAEESPRQTNGRIPEEEDDISCVINDLIDFVDNFPTLAGYHEQKQQKPSSSVMENSKCPRRTSNPSPTLEPPGNRFHFNDVSSDSFMQSEKDANISPVDEQHSDEEANKYPNELQAYGHSNGFEVSEDDKKNFNRLVKQVEAALQEAWRERDEARTWAQEVREATQKWVREQRQKIDLEYKAAVKHSVKTKGMENSTHAEYEARIERLEKSLQTIEAMLYDQNLKRSNECAEDPAPDSAQKDHRDDDFEGSQRWMDHKPRPGRDMEKAPDTRASQRYPLRVHHENRFRPREESFAAQRSLAFQTPKPRLNPAKKRNIGTTPGSFGLSRYNTHSRPRPNMRRSDPENDAGARPRISPISGPQTGLRSNGSSVVRFQNGDIQITSVSPTNSVAYYHAKSQVVQLDNSDGSKVFRFPNAQKERHYPDGRKIVRFPDGTTKRYFPNGAVETLHPSGGYSVIQHPERLKK